MPPAPLPSREVERLAALRSCAILDTTSEEAFDDIVALAARLTESPIALVSLVDGERQWFKARYGLDVSEVPRDQAFCAYAILNPDEPLVVGDATEDARFADHPAVTGAPAIRAYLGVPLVTSEGHALGSLCVVDYVPRLFDSATISDLRILARAVVANLELRRALLRSHEVSLTDTLTGLPNRRATMASLMDALEKGNPTAVIVADLDHFKEVNDGEGHGAGDLLLQAAAARLQGAVRPGDTVGRIGGDEFMVVLAGVTDRDVAAGIARRIGASLRKPVPYGARRLRLGVTLGVAMAPGDATEPEMVMRLADEALVRAKRDDRGGVGCAMQEDRAQLLRAAAIIRAFDGANVSESESEAVQGATAFLQPIVSLGPAPSDHPAIAAFEVLARWAHPAVGEIPPGDLFPLVGPDRAARLGKTVRAQALAGFASLRNNGLEGTRIGLNLSTSEVCRTDLALHLAEEIELAALPLHCIELEITEEVLLDRVSDRTLYQLAALRGRGARLVLDDFGTGNSGLSQLLRLPLDGVKLDKRFVQRLGVDHRAKEIVRATVSLARGLGLHVVAEGVETPAQAAMLRALGCDAAQGFLFARPMSFAAIKTWLEHRHRTDGQRVTALEA